MYSIPNERKKQIDKMLQLLQVSGKSKHTINNYYCAILRFFKYFHDCDLLTLNESNILEYLKINYLDKNCSARTYNMNLCAIRYFYTVNFNIEFNRKLLPNSKIKKNLPTIIEHSTFIKIFNGENNLKHKCWLLLAYTSGLRAEEVAKINISDINSNQHQLKVLGKGNKERFTVLTDITIKYLKAYFKKYCYLKYKTDNNYKGYLFEGHEDADYINSNSITNYFSDIKQKYNLNKSITFHTLRHSFATNFIKAGGDPFILKDMMGHASLNTTSIYIHMGRDFNNLKGVNYDKI